MVRTFIVGIAAGLILGVFFGIYLGHLRGAVQATALGFGAGLGIFALAALIRYLADHLDQVFGQIKAGQRK